MGVENNWETRIATRNYNPVNGITATYRSDLVRFKSWSVTKPPSRPYPIDNPVDHQTNISGYSEVTQYGRELRSLYKSPVIVYPGAIRTFSTSDSWMTDITCPVLLDPLQVVAEEPWMEIRLKMADLHSNLSSYIGEIRETTSLFRRAASALYGAWQLAHGRIPKSLRKSLRHKLTTHDVSAAWVSAHWGLGPILSDLSHSVWEINNLLSKQNTVRFVAKSKQYGRKELTQALVSGEPNYLNTTVDEIDSQCRIILYADYNFDTEPRYISGSPAEALWEGIPFSALVDWVIPVGDFLRSLRATQGFYNMRGCITRRTISVRKSTVSGKLSTGHVVSTEIPHVNRRREVSRTGFSGAIPAVPPYPKFNEGLSDSRLATAIALVHQLVDKPRSGSSRHFFYDP